MAAGKVPPKVTVCDPALQRVIDRLPELPKYLAEKARQREERDKFVRKVWGKIPREILVPKPREE